MQRYADFRKLCVRKKKKRGATLNFPILRIGKQKIGKSFGHSGRNFYLCGKFYAK